MAVYKVPQDVEADDKLIGPFSFRQFIYLLIVAACIGIGWALSRIFIGLAVIVVPPIALFGALALPLRKDQPMEIYLAAVLSFYLKPHQRKWDPDGIDHLIEITTPRVVEQQLTKDLTQAEAQQRLGYLASIVDSQGWAVRGTPSAPTSMNADVYNAAQEVEDVLDTNTSIAQSLTQKLDASDEKRREELVERMTHPAPAPVPQPQQYANPFQNLSQNYSQGVAQNTTPMYNPYPNFQQTVIQPIGDPAHQAAVPVASAPTPVAPPAPIPTPVVAPVQPLPQPQPQPAPQPRPEPVAAVAPTAPEPPKPTQTTEAETTSEKVVSPDIINLANNSDLSIETIAREADRIAKKESKHGGDDEVYISLR